jgi:hypothetical protein
MLNQWPKRSISRMEFMQLPDHAVIAGHNQAGTGSQDRGPERLKRIEPSISEDRFDPSDGAQWMSRRTDPRNPATVTYESHRQAS